MRHVFFPTSGLVSLLTVMQDGDSIELATIGREGFTGLSVFFGADVATSRGIVQVPGEAFRISAERFRHHIPRCPGLQSALAAFAEMLFALVAQTTACNQLHPVSQRLARWLLLTHDRAEQDDFPMTQEFLSQMLGVHRPTVSVAAAALQNTGIIQYRHGKMRVLDRPALEATACECYATIQRQSDRLAP